MNNSGAIASKFLKFAHSAFDYLVANMETAVIESDKGACIKRFLSTLPK